MDLKASARAKHASSQRGRARHSTRKHQPQQQRKQQQTVSDIQKSEAGKDFELPSNWTRYEDGGEGEGGRGGLGGEGEGEDAEKDKRLNVPSVKSKGANYRDLLAEKSLLQGPDLASGRKSLMLTHGRDLWSQFMDMDNLWRINEGSVAEENFFTLDMDFIGKELAKFDIAERLLLDEQFAREASNVANKDSGADVDEMSARSSSINTSPPVTLLNDIESHEEGKSEGSVKAVEEGMWDPKLLGKTGSTSAWTNDYVGVQPKVLDGHMHTKGGEGQLEDAKHIGQAGADSECTKNHSNHFVATQPEIAKCDGHSVARQPFVPLPKIRSLFDAKSAEAELDALLDMIDDKDSRQTASVMPVDLLGLASGPLPLASRGSYPEVLQPKVPLAFHSINSADEKISTSKIKVSNESHFQTMGSTSLAIKPKNVSFDKSDVVGTSKSMSILDDDFDKWLDSL